MARSFCGLDKYVRYTAAAKAVAPYDHVLDVGGGIGDFLDFAGLSGIVADLPPNRSLLHKSNLNHPFVSVCGPLPFRDKSFLAVVSIDTLEHLPDAERTDFLHELLRVAAHRVVLCFPERQPFFSLLVAVGRFYEAVGFGPTMRRSLDEHSRNGLPSARSLLEVLDSGTWRIHEARFFPITGTLLWLLQLFLPFLATWPFNRAMSRLMADTAGERGGEALLILDRRETPRTKLEDNSGAHTEDLLNRALPITTTC